MVLEKMVLQKDILFIIIKRRNKMVYLGSKARLVKYIAPILQKCIDDNHIDTYIEPFVGGANMIENIKCKNRIG